MASSCLVDGIACSESPSLCAPSVHPAPLSLPPTVQLNCHQKRSTESTFSHCTHCTHCTHFALDSQTAVSQPLHSALCTLQCCTHRTCSTSHEPHCRSPGWFGASSSILARHPIDEQALDTGWTRFLPALTSRLPWPTIPLLFEPTLAHPRQGTPILLLHLQTNPLAVRWPQARRRLLQRPQPQTLILRQ